MTTPWPQSGNFDNSTPAVDHNPLDTYPSFMSIPDVAANLAKFIAEFGGEVANIVELIVAWIEAVFNAIIAWCQALRDEALVSLCVTWIEAMLSALLTAVESIIATPLELFPTLITFATSALAATTTFLADFGPALVDTSELVIATGVFITAVVTATRVLLTGIGLAVPTLDVTSWATTISGKINTTITNLVTIIDGLESGFGVLDSGLTDILKTLFSSEMWTYIADTIKALIPHLAPELASGLTGLGLVFTDIVGSLGIVSGIGSGSPVFAAVGDIPVLGPLFDTYLANLDVTGAMAYTAITGLETYVEGLITTALGDVSLAVGSITGLGTGVEAWLASGGALPSATTIAYAAITDFASAVDALINSALGDIPSSLISAGTLAGSAISGGLSSLTTVGGASDVSAMLGLVGVPDLSSFANLLRGLFPAATSGYNGTAVANAVTGFTDNLNGTVSYLAGEAETDVTTLIQQADGTIVTASQVAQQVAAAAAQTVGGSVGAAIAAGPQAGTNIASMITSAAVGDATSLGQAVSSSVSQVADMANYIEEAQNRQCRLSGKRSREFLPAGLTTGKQPAVAAVLRTPRRYKYRQPSMTP